jgi:hypothetical protein
LYLSGYLFSSGTPPTFVQLQPDASQIPLSSVLEHLANGIGGWALIAAMLGVVVGAVMWGCTQRTLRSPMAG